MEGGGMKGSRNVQRKLRCIIYMDLLTTMSAINMYCEHVLIKIFNIFWLLILIINLFKSSNSTHATT